MITYGAEERILKVSVIGEIWYADANIIECLHTLEHNIRSHIYVEFLFSCQSQEKSKITRVLERETRKTRDNMVASVLLTKDTIQGHLRKIISIRKMPLKPAMLAYSTQEAEAGGALRV